MSGVRLAASGDVAETVASKVPLDTASRYSSTMSSASPGSRPRFSAISMNVSRRSSLMDSSSRPESFNMRSKSARGVLARTRRVRGASPLAGAIGTAGAGGAGRGTGSLGGNSDSRKEPVRLSPRRIVPAMSPPVRPMSRPSFSRLVSASAVSTLSVSAKSRNFLNSLSAPTRARSWSAVSMCLRRSGLSNSARASARYLGARSMPPRSNCARGLLGWFLSGSFFCHHTRSKRVFSSISSLVGCDS